MNIKTITGFCLGVLIGFQTLAVQSKTDRKQEQKRFSILGLGDSITEGGGSFQSYLFPLWEKLFSAGYSFDFIGPRSSKCRIGTLNHSGFSGRNAEFLDARIDSIYRKYPADIVLMHTGHNHFVEEQPVAGIIRAQESIIRKILTINPDAKILVAQVIQSGKLPKYDYIPELNQQIAQLVARLNSKNVVLVNQAQGFDWNEMTIADKVHPNQRGAEKMAEVWFKALKTVLAPSGQQFSPEVVSYKSIGSTDLKLHIFKPERIRKNEKRPALVFFFGGGWAVGTPMQFYRECAYYASKGIVTIAAEYRISYLHNSTPFDSFDDAKDAIRWLRQHADELNLDANRIAAAGSSAGGQLAAATGTIKKTSAEKSEVSYKPNLLVLYYAVIDNGEKGYGPAEMKKRFQEISPLHHVDATTPPTLFLLGTKDQLIPVSTAEMFKQKMNEAGVPCELHLFEGAGHPIFLYAKEPTENFYKVRKLTDDFLKKYRYLK